MLLPQERIGVIMDMNKCCNCQKSPLSKDEIGITRKLIDKKAIRFYCLSCLAETLETTVDELRTKIEEFKAEGCDLFR